LIQVKIIQIDREQGNSKLVMLLDITSQADLHNKQVESDWQDKISLSLNNNLKTPVSTVQASIEMVREYMFSQNPERVDYMTKLFEAIESSLLVVKA
jgi:hypothetical protein